MKRPRSGSFLPNDFVGAGFSGECFSGAPFRGVFRTLSVLGFEEFFGLLFFHLQGAELVIKALSRIVWNCCCSSEGRFRVDEYSNVLSMCLLFETVFERCFSFHLY